MIKILFIRNAKMISAVKLKKSIASICIFCIIVSKLRYRKKPYTIILFKFDKKLKVSFYCAILPLKLAIFLRIESS